MHQLSVIANISAEQDDYSYYVMVGVCVCMRESTKGENCQDKRYSINLKCIKEQSRNIANNLRVISTAFGMLENASQVEDLHVYKLSAG